MPPPVMLLLAVFLAATVQTVGGFGFAMITIPLMAPILGLRATVPLVILIGLFLTLINAVRNRKSIDWREVRSVAPLALVGVPIGVWFLSSANERLVEATLGVLLIAYGALSLAHPRARPLVGPLWGYPAGFVAGCLGGAFSLPGPVMILYGTLRRWAPDNFRATLQAISAIVAPLAVLSHAAAGNITVDTLRLFALAIPAFLLGIFVGSRLTGRLDLHRAAQVIYVLMIVLGVSLFF